MDETHDGLGDSVAEGYISRRRALGVLIGVGLAHPVVAASRLAGLPEASDMDVTNSILPRPKRQRRTDLGIAQQSDGDLKWLRDAKFGMFIHWGLYAGPGEGEWMMHQRPMAPEEYRRLAYPESGDDYFAADAFDPHAWAQLGKDAGMKWMCLTARHHDGYCLFDSPHPNAFTSVQTHKRDFVDEYVRACRAAGLKVGLYYSPLSWRYPGYYDVTGTDCKPNPFGYTTDPAHKENARMMKEENCANVRCLMTGYGRIDHVFWDGGWLAEHGSDADAAYFHEPGLYMDPTNPWPVDPRYVEHEAGTGKAFGFMGVTRRRHPHVVVNPRSGWIGDFRDEEGSSAVVGPIREPELSEKCMTTAGAWGYDRAAIEGGHVLSAASIVEYLCNCVVRDMVLLLNVGPDRHGTIPEVVAKELRKAGAWIAKMAPAIYATRGGPWQPVDGEVGFASYRDTMYAFLFSGFQGGILDLMPVGKRNPVSAVNMASGSSLPFVQRSDRSVEISGVARDRDWPVTVLCIRFDRAVNV